LLQNGTRRWASPRHAGNGAGRLGEAEIERHAFGLGELRAAEIPLDEHDRIHVVAEPHRLDVAEAPDEEPRADQQYDRERRLDKKEQGPRAVRRPPVSGLRR